MKNKIVLIIAGILIVIGLYFIFRHNSNSAAVDNSGNMAGMNMGGDPGRRYTVSFSTDPAQVLPNQNVQLKFKIYDAASGNAVTTYDTIMTKLMHLVIVDSNLVYFDHIHPVQNGSEFTITTKFPKSDLYRLYINFQPDGGTEQQIGFSLPVGNSPGNTSSNVPVDTSLTKTFGDYEVALSNVSGSGFSANDMNNMAEILNFHITSAQTGQPITDLEPYLGAFGHLVMINEQTYHYIHVHPIASDNDVAGGPDVKFLPAGTFDKIEPGIYRVFAQFQRNGQVFVADFTIKIGS